MTKVNGKNNVKHTSVRIKSESKNKAKSILLNANKKKHGRTIKLPDLIELAINLLTDEHIKVLQERSLSFEDRKEILRQNYIQKCGFISKDEFIGFMMQAEFQEFLKGQQIGA